MLGFLCRLNNLLCEGFNPRTRDGCDTSESWNDKQSGERQERTEWHRVVLRGGLANTAEKYLKKGSKVYIKGPMKTRKYTDSSNVERYVTEIVGLSMVMLDGAPQGRQQQGQQQNNGFSEDPYYSTQEMPQYDEHGNPV